MTVKYYKLSRSAKKKKKKNPNHFLVITTLYLGDLSWKRYVKVYWFLFGRHLMFLPLKIKSLTYDWLMRANLPPKFIWLFFRRNISNSLEFILSFVWRIDSSLLRSITVYFVKILPTQQPTLFSLFLIFVIYFS